MSKELGLKLLVKFSQPLTGDVTNNETAFIISGKERKYINGPLIEGNYIVKETSRKGQFERQLIDILPEKKCVISEVTASSTFANNNYIPSKVVDGDLTTVWLSYNKYGQQYLQLRCTDIEEITFIKVSCISPYIPQKFNISVSVDGVSYTIIKKDCVITEPLELQTFHFDQVACKYIRLNMTSSPQDYYTIGEVEVYGGGEIYGDVFVIDPNTDDTEISVTMQDFKRFQNVEGALKIKYDSTKGNLTGAGGFVESFEYSFLPTDLISKIDPNHDSKFMITPTINIQLKLVTYNDRYIKDKFMVMATSNIVLTKVGEVNP